MTVPAGLITGLQDCGSLLPLVSASHPGSKRQLVLRLEGYFATQHKLTHSD